MKAKCQTLVFRFYRELEFDSWCNGLVTTCASLYFFVITVLAYFVLSNSSRT